ncbi:MAG TPA: hypothetical protein VEY70_13230 [Metabacillus sp.]|nr:hypothetical protein [Metabacillus sp.]
MKISLIATDDVLMSALSEHFEVEFVPSIQNAKGEILIISDQHIPYDELTSYQFDSFSYVFYMLSNQYKPSLEKVVKAICDSRDIQLIPTRLTVQQIVETILMAIQPKVQSKNVVCFFSSISNSGTTSTTLSVAQVFQKFSDAKVGVLLLNAWDSGTDFIKYHGNYLDEVKSRLAGQLFENENEFLSQFHMVVQDRLYILAGNRDTRMERLYTKDEIYYLIQKAKETFDLVLIDAGCHFDNANLPQSLKESDLRFLIVNQQVKARRKFLQFYQDILYPLGYQKDDFLMVINQYNDKPYYSSTKEIYAELNIPLITTIPYTRYGLNAEMENTFLYDYDDYGYQEAIHILSKSIAATVDIPLALIDIQSKPKKRFSFGLNIG